MLKELKLILQVLFDRYFIKMKTELFFKTFNWGLLQNKWNTVASFLKGTDFYFILFFFQ